jgi:hypothetical protein
MSDRQVMDAVERILDARTELQRREVAPGDILVILGCALGTMLAGGSR